MSVMLVRATVKDDCVTEVDQAVQAMFTAIDRAEPEGVRYASCKAADGKTYVILLELEDGIENPLPAVPEFRAFQGGLQGWLDQPTSPEHLTVVGSYNLF
jgi:hypothetical protein